MAERLTVILRIEGKTRESRRNRIGNWVGRNVISNGGVIKMGSIPFYGPISPLAVLSPCLAVTFHLRLHAHSCSHKLSSSS